MIKTILIILPKSIAGCLILKGLSLALNEIGFNVVVVNIDDINNDIIKTYSIQIVLGYDYSYLMDDNVHNILSQFKNLIFIHYFADIPTSQLALGDKDIELYNILKTKKNTIIYIWDENCLNLFPNSKFLPLGINANLYKQNFQNYKYPISFVGRPLTNKRIELICQIVKKYSNKFNLFCFKTHFEKSVDFIIENKLLNKNDLNIYKNCYQGFLKTEDELAFVYNSSCINLNITIQGENNINYRVYEVLASEGFLLTDKMDSIFKNFEVGKDLEVYNDVYDLFDKIDFYLKNQYIAEQIAINGCKKVKTNHSFEKIALKIKDDILKLGEVKNDMQ